MTDPDVELDELLPRRFGARALTITGGLLLVGTAMTYLVIRDAPEPIAAAGEPVTFESIDTLFMEVRVKDALPQGARAFDPEAEARSAGLLGALQEESGHFLASPYGSAYATGNADEDVWGGLTGTEVGEAHGAAGLGLLGTGRGGGGPGEGTIGLGAHGSIGKGGGGTGHGYGARGRRGMNESLRRLGPLSLADATRNEGYARIDEHDFVAIADDARSTFSIDVDTASYSNVRRFLDQGQLPPADAVRIEELVNYFDYEYDPPTGDVPFAVHSEVAPCPWNERNLLVQVGLKGQMFDHEDLPARNFVFLVDVSGSMSDRLPLVRQSLGLLVDHLRPQDRVGIVVYAGASGMVLEPTTGEHKPAIRASLERLEAGGSTNGGAGIELAYRLASKHFVEGGANRVILATDGDFNVGVTSEKSLERLIEKKRQSGVFLSVLGYGQGNLQDATMEGLADQGNGNYAYIDSIDEARKVLVDEAAATLVTIAKDVKIQVELDPTEVASWRLVGYENRKLAHQDFQDDAKDAGEIGAGHTVTALYEIVPKRTAAQRSNPLMKVALRWKAPDGDTSTAIEHTIGSDARSLASTSDDFRLAAAAAQFGMLLRGSDHKGGATWASTIALTEGAMGDEPTCERTELAQLVGRAAQLSGIDARARARASCKKA
ncbi:MAG TPA: VWA domain-containing protein [Nannocystaceae bacterium]|nr:VWA domain-containing protein [Nannocystaceae bacterium]